MKSGCCTLPKPKLLYYLDRGGCGYWRCRLPIDQMVKQDLVEVRVIEKAWQTAGKTGENISWSDIILQQSVIGADAVAVALKYHDLGKKLSVDFDDYPWECDPLNHHYSRLGLDEVTIEDPTTGDKTQLWKHGVNGFDVIKNRIKKKSWNDLLKVCDLVTCTTPYLRNRIVNSVLNEEQGVLNIPFHPENVVAIPNAIDFEKWKPAIGSRYKWGDEFRIGYVCGASHMSDWLYISTVMFDFLKRHKDSKLVVLGDIGFDLKKRYPMEQIEEWHWADLYAGTYHFMLSTMGLDVGIAPLEPTKEFNRCKSNIKFLEYTACGYPSILQNMTPYKEDGVDGENCLLASDQQEWGRALEKMYHDRILRKKLAMSAMNTAKALYDIKNVAREWADIYSQTIFGKQEGRKLILA